MAFDVSSLGDVVYEISLATATPSDFRPFDKARVSAAASSLSAIAAQCASTKREYLVGVIPCLLDLIKSDPHSSAAAKSADALASISHDGPLAALMVESEGIRVMADAMRILIAEDGAECGRLCTESLVIEGIVKAIRELANTHEYCWPIAQSGLVPFLVIVLRTGRKHMRTMAAGCLASMGDIEDISLMTFTAGAVFPLVEVATYGGQPAHLSSLGALVQLCTIPESTGQLIEAGAVKLFVNSLFNDGAVAGSKIREKAMCALYNLAAFKTACEMISGQDRFIEGWLNEVRGGTETSRVMGLRMLSRVVAYIPAETRREFCHIMVHVLEHGRWREQAVCLSHIVHVTNTPEDRVWFVDHNVIPVLLNVLHTRREDLQEPTFLSLITLCQHRDLPARAIEQGLIEGLIPYLSSYDHVLRDIAAGFLKALAAFDRDAVYDNIDEELLYLLSDHDLPKAFRPFIAELLRYRKSFDYIPIPDDVEEVYGVPMHTVRRLVAEIKRLDAEATATVPMEHKEHFLRMLNADYTQEELDEIMEDFEFSDPTCFDLEEILALYREIVEFFGTDRWAEQRKKYRRGKLRQRVSRVYRWLYKNTLEQEAVQEARWRRIEEAEAKARVEAEMVDNAKAKMQEKMEKRAKQARTERLMNKKQL